MPSGSARVCSTAIVCGKHVGVDDERGCGPRLPARRIRVIASAAAVASSSNDALATASPVRSVDHRLEVQQRLEPALADLRLVRRVRGVPGRVLQHVAADHRRGERAVVAQADHRARDGVRRPSRAARRAPRPRRAAAGSSSAVGPRRSRIAGTALSASSSSDATPTPRASARARRHPGRRAGRRRAGRARASRSGATGRATDGGALGRGTGRQAGTGPPPRRPWPHRRHLRGSPARRVPERASPPCPVGGRVARAGSRPRPLIQSVGPARPWECLRGCGFGVTPRRPRLFRRVARPPAVCASQS